MSAAEGIFKDSNISFHMIGGTNSFRENRVQCYFHHILYAYRVLEMCQYYLPQLCGTLVLVKITR